MTQHKDQNVIEKTLREHPEIQLYLQAGARIACRQAEQEKERQDIKPDPALFERIMKRLQTEERIRRAAQEAQKDPDPEHETGSFIEKYDYMEEINHEEKHESSPDDPDRDAGGDGPVRLQREDDQPE